MITLIGETYWELFRNRPHWLFELTVEVATFVVATLPIRWWVKRHDLDHPTMVEFKKLQKRVAELEGGEPPTIEELLAAVKESQKVSDAAMKRLQDLVSKSTDG